MDVAGDFVEQCLIGVTLVAADVHHERTAVGDDVVLGAGIDHGYAHLDRTQQGRYLLEAVVAKPGDVVQHLVDGVVAFFAGSVSRAACGSDVEHHQTLFGNGGLHFGRFAHEGKRQGRQFGKHAFDASGAGNFFLARSQVDQVVVLACAAQLEEHL